MPQLERRHDLSAASLWEGRCPVDDCPMWFQIEADPGQPRWDVLKTFNQIRPRTRHLHGSFWVVDDIEQGGE
jgi:hypothetical protein